MVEDIYKEEFGDAETETKSSPEHAPVTQEVSALKDTEEGLQESLIIGSFRWQTLGALH